MFCLCLFTYSILFRPCSYSNKNMYVVIIVVFGSVEQNFR